MPELPEVETIRRQLEPLVTGRLITGAGSHPSAKFSPARLLVGAVIRGAARRGKYLLFPTDDDRELVAHLGMAGAFQFEKPRPDPEGPYLRAWWRLGPSFDQPEQALLFTDVRRFGRLRVVPAGDYSLIPTLAGAGPEPFDPDFDGQQFWELLAVSRRKLKTKLLSQRPIAGVGNIYADEALWLARINPSVTRLSRPRATELLAAIRQVLAQALDNGGTTLRDYRTVDGGTGQNQTRLRIYGRAGQQCFRCQTVLVSAVLDGRTTTWCRSCQKR